MRELIRDLLAHATSSSRAIVPSRVDLTALVAEVVGARHAEGQVRHGRLPAVAGDPVLVRQVLDNLVGNALKYVAPGTEPRVGVTARVTGDLVRVCVSDNGVGVPPGEHERIFEEFHRAHYRDFEGSGLGLAICRRIITRHGGTIVARDNPAGQGTVFEFTLPAYVVPAGPVPPEPSLGDEAEAGPVPQLG
jgi:signal transduction histidine kinase